MSVGRTLAGLWKSREETTDRHKDGRLRTRYYRESKSKLMDKVESLIQSKGQGWKLVHVSRDHGEVVVEVRQFTRVMDVVITVYSVSVLRSAVDITVAKRGGVLGDLGSSYHIILSLFDALDKVSSREQAG